MKYDDFTVNDIIHGTGLSRQRIHALIKSRGIPTRKAKNKLIVNWMDLLKLMDNPTVLKYLKLTLEREKKRLNKANEGLKEDEEAIRYGKAFKYALVLLQGRPAMEENQEKWKLWDKAFLFFDDLIRG